MTTHADVVEAARSWLDVPYLHQGRTRHGVDCVGLVIAVAHQLSLSDFDVDGYSRVPSGSKMARLLREQTARRLNLYEIEPGDLLHLLFSNQPQHLAIVSRTDPDFILHADSRAGRVVEQRLDDEWRARVRGAYRLPGLSSG